MKHLLHISFLALLPFLFASCSHKSHSNTADYMIVAQVGGFTGGAHGPFYYITSSEIKADNTSFFSTLPQTLSGYNFNTAIPSTRFPFATSLLSSIPLDMMVHNHKDYGTMPGNDMYSIAIIASIGGVTYQWGIELDRSNCSAEVQQFASKISMLY